MNKTTNIDSASQSQVVFNVKYVTSIPADTNISAVLVLVPIQNLSPQLAESYNKVGKTVWR